MKITEKFIELTAPIKASTVSQVTTLAEYIAYDNEDSGLSSSTVQGAIDEIQVKTDKNLMAFEYEESTGNMYAVLGNGTTIKDVSTDENGNVIIEQEIR